MRPTLPPPPELELSGVAVPLPLVCAGLSTCGLGLGLSCGGGLGPTAARVPGAATGSRPAREKGTKRLGTLQSRCRAVQESIQSSIGISVQHGQWSSSVPQPGNIVVALRHPLRGLKS